jgi:uncharacterized protein (TIGR00266 family)
MKEQIRGTVLQVLEITLEQGEMVFAEAGELSWMTSSIHMRTGMTTGGQKGGVWGLVKRALGGGTLFMSEYTAITTSGTIAFAARAPGQILTVDLEPERSTLIHRHGFVCGTPGVQLAVGFQRSLGAGVFGGEGFLLQRVTGPGRAFIELSGEVVPYDLEPGETLRVHPGHVGMFDQSVTFDITTVPGIANKLFGGDGLFLVTLTGPGRVWLQSLPLPNLAHALVPYLPRPEPVRE